MEMQQVRYFVALAKTRNFTRAAEHCNVTQPSLTRGIRQLEEELGGNLLRRERNNTHLSDLGQLLLPYLEGVLSNVQGAKTTASSMVKLTDAPLKIGVMCTIGPLRFIGFFAKFRRERPGVDLSLVEGAPERLLQMMDQGELDVD